MTSKANWQQTVRPYFDFLLEQGFALDPGAGYSEWYGTAVAYRSDVGAVEITRSVEFDRVEVELVLRRYRRPRGLAAKVSRLFRKS